MLLELLLLLGSVALISESVPSRQLIFGSLSRLLPALDNPQPPACSSLLPHTMISCSQAASLFCPYQQ